MFAADSVTENPILTTDDDCFKPVGIPIMIGSKSINNTGSVLEHLCYANSSIGRSPSNLCFSCNLGVN